MVLVLNIVLAILFFVWAIENFWLDLKYLGYIQLAISATNAAMAMDVLLPL